MLTGSHPVLAVHDLAVSGGWYEAVFDAVLHDVDVGNWVFCRAGDVSFMLGRCPDATPAAELGDHSYVAYLDVAEPSGVDAVHARAVEAGAEVLKPPTDEPWGQREMALRSPDGHRFMVAASIPTG